MPEPADPGSNPLGAYIIAEYVRRHHEWVAARLARSAQLSRQTISYPPLFASSALVSMGALP
jgi:hypothetical protein